MVERDTGCLAIITGGEGTAKQPERDGVEFRKTKERKRRGEKRGMRATSCLSMRQNLVLKTKKFCEAKF